MKRLGPKPCPDIAARQTLHVRQRVAERIMLLQGPTISPVFTPANGGGAAAEHGFYAATICVPKKKLYASVKALRKVCHGLLHTIHSS